MELTCDGVELIWTFGPDRICSGGNLVGRDSGDASGGDGLKLALKLFV